MSKLQINKNPEVDQVFKNYPKHIQPKVRYLYNLVVETAAELADISDLEITLKWGEPSFLTPIGSTIRMDWKAKKPDQYALYFKCTSKLVSTFREIYGDKFNYEKNRAIVFNLEETPPREELKACIGMALRYHRVKELVRLGG